MSWIDAARHRLRAVVRGESARHDAEDELAFHVSLDAMHAERAGRSPEASRAEARQRLGNVTALSEERRSVSRWRLADELAQDIRYAWRVMRRAPAFTVGAALTLAIGIGAATAVFSIIDAVLIRGLPYGDANHLVWVLERSDSGAFRASSYPDFRDWERERAVWNRSLDGLAFVRGRGAWVDGPDGRERLLAAQVTSGFFPLMRTAPLLGRTFLPDEETRSGSRVAVLAFETWRRDFGSDRGVVGRTVDIDSTPTTVVGVMPPGFVYPQWFPGQQGKTSMWLPIAAAEGTDEALAKRNDHSDSRLIGRIKPASDSAAAASALGIVTRRVQNGVTGASHVWNNVALISIPAATIGNASSLLFMLGGAVLLVLVLACVNFANLSFVRGAARARELAVRAALGAGRGRVIRQLLTESVGIALFAGAGGAAIAATLVGLTRSFATNQLPRVEEIVVDRRLLAFAVLLAIAAAVVSALVPALSATRRAPVHTIRGGAQSAVAGRFDARVRGTLVVAQLALALVMLVGTGLLLQSFRRVSEVPAGVDLDGVIESRLTPPAQYRRAEDAVALYTSIVERLRAIPGVEAVAFSNPGTVTTTVTRDGDTRPGDLGTTAGTYFRTVSEDYLRVTRMRLVSGRWLTAGDVRSRDAFVINETLAKSLFPASNPIGQRIVARHASRVRPEFGQPIVGTVVGVVGDTHQNGAEAAPQSEIFVPYTVDVWAWVSLMVRTRDMAHTIPLARRALLDADPAIPEGRASAAYGGFGPSNNSQPTQRMLVLVALATFSAAALTLAAVGLYSVISYSVSQRTREVGVRVALGATRGGIAALVLGEGLKLAAIGTAIGLGGAYAAARLIRSLLFQTAPTDGRTYVVTALVLFGTATIACVVPSWRASRLSPTDAIRGG